MTTRLTFQEMYEAIVRKDSSFEGLFVTAVKTTGIFCRPVCMARKPKPQNVVFYQSVQEALQHGYRPCRLCKPMEQADETPPFIQALLQALSEDPFLRIKDADLRRKGMEPNAVRRWFKKNHRISFHSYQRMLRINAAFYKISNGQPVTEAAFDSGYHSLSGFSDSYRAIFGKSPTQSENKSIIHSRRFTTPLGPMFGCATERGVCLFEFTDRKMLETEFNDLKRRLDAVILPGNNEHLDELEKEIKEYFRGDRTTFTVPLHTPGSEFQQCVWDALCKIPYGATRSYKEQALFIKRESAVRAVAAANGANRVAIIIPCHRVVGSDGTLTGYGGGLARKKWLLDFEQSNRRLTLD